MIIISHSHSFSVYALSALFFGSTIQSILFSKLSHTFFHSSLTKKIIIIALPLCFVRIAIIIETGIEKGGHKKIMKLNFPCKVFFLLCTEISRAFHFVYPFEIFSILFKLTTIPTSFIYKYI